MAELVTVRIPELPAVSEDHPLTLDDTLPIWSADDNITRHTKLSDLRNFIETGGQGGYSPVVAGAVVVHIVSAAEAGGNIISIPSLAGEQFYLRRDGQPLIPYNEEPGSPPAEYAVLSSGGMQLLLPGDELIEGQRFEFYVFSLIGGGTTPPPSSGGGSFIKGKVVVQTNFPMNITHLGKLMQIRAVAEKITITLPNLTDIPANTIIPFETSITNTFQARITTQGGQNIYLNNVAKNDLYMGIGESLWLFRDDDGFYVINDFSRIYQELGDVKNSYKVGLNQVQADGSLLLRADYPRLWEWVQTLGSSLVSDSTWLTASVDIAGRTVPNPYRGCYSTGDGTTTFRVPNLMNVALRGLKSYPLGVDDQRHLNKPGGFQLNEVLSHNHTVTSGGKQYNRLLTIDNTSTVDSPDNTLGEPNLALSQPMQPYGGAETRMDNVGVVFTIKC